MWGHTFPETALTVWGARAITDRHGLIDILPDRQSSRGPDAERLLLARLLHEFGAFDHIQAAYKKALAGGFDGGEIVLLSHPALRCEARLSPHFDYLYLSIWLTTDLSRFELVQEAPDGLGDDQLIWSCDSPPPALGALIRATNADWALVNPEDNLMEVLGYGVEYGYLFCWGRLLGTFTERKADQDQRSREAGRWTPFGSWNVMGREWAPAEKEES